MHKVKLIVNTLSSPLQIGVYVDNEQIEIIISSDQTSDALPPLIHDLLQRFPIDTIAYVNGPGSYMAVKVAYMLLKSIAIVQGIKLVASDGFAFSNQKMIKAIGKQYFFKEKGDIVTKKLEQHETITFSLPKAYDEVIFHDEITPLYILPAV
jgi:tRNA A37 threonylcarbamoyladenosine modification protein TsaB